jgi:hypothetical protein
VQNLTSPRRQENPKSDHFQQLVRICSEKFSIKLSTPFTGFQSRKNNFKPLFISYFPEYLQGLSEGYSILYPQAGPKCPE